MKSILYISDVNPTEPIFHSQVVPHVQKLRQYAEVLLVVLTREQLSNLEDYELYSYTSIRADYILQLSKVNFFRQKKDLKKVFSNMKFDIIYSRGIRGGIVGAFFKKYIYEGQIPLINDVRGDAIDENKESYFVKSSLDKANKFIFKNTDWVFSVSTYLKNKICSTYQFDLNKSSVFPTFVPDDKFSFNENNRSEIRSALNYHENDVVIIYSGNLAKWQNIDVILEAFSKTTNPRLKLLLLTRDVKIDEKLNEFTLDSSRIEYMSVNYSEIEKYYHAGDFGILIRDNTDTNKSAAPTKFSEYVNSGLELIINKIDADYVSLFQTLNMNGVLLHDKNELASCFSQLHEKVLVRNTIKVNTLSDIVTRQMKILKSLK